MDIIEKEKETGLTIAYIILDENVGEERLEDSKTVEEQGTVKEQFGPDPNQEDIEKNSKVEESD